jgi:hypothetical protein
MAVEKIINLKVNDDIKDTENNVVSLKRQLREAQQDVQTLSDKFGATSREAVEAAKRAAELKDRIGDAKTLTDAFNPDAKFRSLSASLSGVAGGFAAYQGALGLAGVESKKLQEQLLKVQSAMALAQGLQGLGEARDSFKQLGAVAADALRGIKTGLLATGIGVFVVALGAIVAYWDDIKQAVNGVSAAQGNLNAKVNANYQTQLLNLKTLDNQDNVLRLQGKSEEYILKKKNEQITKAIELGQVALKQNISNVKAEVAAAERNEKYTKLIFERSLQLGTFIVRMIAKPFDVIIAGVNKVSDALGFQKVAAMNVTDVLDAGIDKATTFVATKLFDSAGIKAEGQKATQALTEELQNLENTKAGNQIKINEGNKKAGKENNDNNEKSIQEGFDNERKLIEEKLKNDKISIDEKRNIVLEDNKLSKEDKTKFLLELHDKEIQLEVEKNKKLAELEQAKIAKEDEQWLKLQELTLEKSDYDALVRQQKFEKEYIAAEGNAELQLALKNDYLKKEEESEKANAEAIKKIEEEKAAAKAKALSAISSGLKTAATLLGESTAAGKAAAVAAATIDTIQSGVSAYKGMVAAVPGPVGIALGAVAAAGSLVSGYASVKKILAVKTPGGGGASAGGGGAAAPAPPSFNIVGQNSNNQLAQTIAGQQQQPLQAYVVSGNVSSAQSLDRNRIDTATFN